MKSISVVIPNYNGRSLLEANLPSVHAALDAVGPGHEVIVADDASTDESVAYLEAYQPGVVVVKGEENGGFSTNINRGLRAATRELVFALNSDVRLTEDYFEPLLEYFDEPDTFGVMGSIRTEDGVRLLDGGKYPEYSFGRIRSTLNYRPAEGSKRAVRLPTLFLSGANALIDREKLERGGYFSELFSPFYGEDVELGVRAWRLGWRCYYEPRAICHHSLGATISSFREQKEVRLISTRNRILLNRLHLDGGTFRLWHLLFRLQALVRGMVFDTRYWKAQQLYRERRAEAEEARERFAELQRELGCTLSLRRVVAELQEEIAGLEITRF